MSARSPKNISAIILGVALSLVLPISAAAAPPSAMPPGEIQRAIERLNVVGSVLYIAAHPDDENTRLIGWLVGYRGVQTAYLSMTRGGGGQNLIGGEQADLLGVVRTGELLAARGVDGAMQFFSRMRDFGYSKSPKETLNIWGHDAALSDVVQTIRTFRPDVIISRFATSGRNHGHHTASAILAGEAFKAAADPEQFKALGLAPWQADRLLHNRSHWRMKPSTDKSGFMKLDVGTYDPHIGQSYGEVAAESRSMHKSQGFGSAPRVGPQMEYFSSLDGISLQPADDIFKGLDLGWSRFEGTKGLSRAITKAAKAFNPAAPYRVLAKLADIRARIATVSDPHWRDIKLAEVDRIMVSCAGLWLTARAKSPSVSPGSEVEVTLTALNRSGAKVTLIKAEVGDASFGRADLMAHTPWRKSTGLTPETESPLSGPHWLQSPPTLANYVITDRAKRILADARPVLTARFYLDIIGARIMVERPVEYAWTDAVAGERRHPVDVVPPVTASYDRRVLMVPVGTNAITRITLRSVGAQSGTLKLQAPAGFDLNPAQVDFELSADKPERVIEVTLTAKEGATPGPLLASVQVAGRTWALAEAVIDYPHLPKRTVLQGATLPIVPVAIERGGVNKVGYIQGSGDAVADALTAMGYSVEEIDEDTVVAGDLARFDAVVMGIRAYNKRPRLLSLHGQLMAYIAGGGRLIVQYNTNNHFNPLDGPIGPKPFHISRNRVTDETATMTAIDANHPALTTPNRLGAEDYEGWVQERGLYFADTWDAAYTPIFSAHDPGAKPVKGSVLVARHGKGVFVYTGISFFRQLPAGVAGAYRLLANLLAL